MLEIDETALIEFFGVLPTPQDPDEAEFFGTTIFEISRDGLYLTISFSSHHDDCRLDLRSDPESKAFLEFQLDDVREVEVKRDKPTAPPVLHIAAPEKESGGGYGQVVRIEVDPDIRIRADNRSSIFPG